MFCPNCGTKLPDGSKFCVGCGSKMPETAAPAAPVQPVPAAPVTPAKAPKPKKTGGINWTVLIVLLLVGALIIGAGAWILIRGFENGFDNIFGDGASQNDDDDDDDDDDDNDKDDNDKDDNDKDDNDDDRDDPDDDDDDRRPVQTTPGTATNPTHVATPENSDIVGNWAISADMTDLMNASFGVSEDMLHYLEVDYFYVTYYLTFHDDGTYDMQTDTNSFNDSLEHAKDIWETGFTQMIRDQGANVEDVLAQLGYATMRDYIDSLMAHVDYSSMNGTGYYKYDGNILELDHEEYVVTVNSQWMQIEQYLGSSSQGQMVFDILSSSRIYRS